MSRLVLAAAALGLSALPAAAGCVGECYRQSYVPPSYDTITEKVVVQAPRTYAVTTPAEYRTVHDTVLVSPGGRHWSVTVDAYGHKVGCWVTTPPRYASVARTVMVRAPQVIPYATPAQYGYRSYTVQTSPGYKTWTPVGYGHRPGYGGYGRGADYGYGGGPVGGLVGAGAGLAGAGLDAGFGLAGSGLGAAGF